MKHRAAKLRTFATVQQHIHSDPTLERHYLTELNQTAWPFRLTDKPKSRTLALEAKDRATRLEKTDELAQSLLTLAVVSFQEGEVESSLAMGEEAYHLIETMPKSTRQSLLVRAVNFLIGVHYRLGKRRCRARRLHNGDFNVGASHSRRISVISSHPLSR